MTEVPDTIYLGAIVVLLDALVIPDGPTQALILACVLGHLTVQHRRARAHDKEHR